MREWNNLGPFFPKIYSANDISDFLKNKDNLKVTRSLLPVGVFFYNSVFIKFENSVIFKKENENYARISDLTNFFMIPIDSYFQNACKGRNIYDYKRLYGLSIFYKPKKDIIKFVDFNLDGPPSPEPEMDQNELEKFLEFI